MTNKKLNCILLVDDDEDSNFFHLRLLKKMDIAEQIAVALDGKEALDFLTSEEKGVHPRPAIIFLDINMPVMDGWDFLEAYDKLKDDQKGNIILIMLTTSLNPDDKQKALKSSYVKDFKNKYLKEEDINEMLEKHFPDLIK